MSKPRLSSRHPSSFQRAWQVLRVALLVVFCASLGTLSASARPRTKAAAAASGKMLSVTVEEANFRKGPSTRHDIAFTAIRHYPVRQLKRSKGWALVEDFEGEQAWVLARLLAPNPAVIIRVDKANVRARPTTKAQVVHKAGRGEVFEVIASKGKWIKLSAEDSLKGWLRQDLAWGASKR